MKKSLKNLFTFIFSASLFSFLSCQDVIFDEIRNEVKLDDATVSGSILSMVRYKDDIYVATGIIKHQSKERTSSNWQDLEEIPEGKIYSLASDSSNLYACSLTFEDDDDGYNVPAKRILSKYDGNSWKTLLTVSYSSSYFFAFGTNAPQEANRHAFFRYGSNVYELSDSITENSTSIESWSALSTEYEIANEGELANVKSAACLGSKVILSPYRASTSNETESDEATYVYTASGDDIYYSTDGATWTQIDTDSDDIISMGFSQDYMLLGTDEGIQHVKITDNIPGTSTQDFSNNAASALSSYYIVETLLVVDPSKSEYDTPIFASIEFDGSSSSTSATLKNVGLWGYYQGRGEWNRE